MGLEREEPTAVDASPGWEATLRLRLRDDPNDSEAFQQLIQVVTVRAARDAGVPISAHDVVWAVAEEFARTTRAWYPLIELAQLSLDRDREGALRRLSTAAERDPSGRALARGLATLRRAGLPDDALRLGIGHWRPRDHGPETGVHLVLAAVEAGRPTEAKRHLAILRDHTAAPDVGLLGALLARYGEGKVGA